MAARHTYMRAIGSQPCHAAARTRFPPRARRRLGASRGGNRCTHVHSLSSWGAQAPVAHGRRTGPGKRRARNSEKRTKGAVARELAQRDAGQNSRRCVCDEPLGEERPAAEDLPRAARARTRRDDTDRNLFLVVHCCQTKERSATCSEDGIIGKQRECMRARAHDEGNHDARVLVIPTAR
jgi:hypothetical protein